MNASGGSRGGARGASLFWVNKEEMTEGIKASRASKTAAPLPLSSRSGSATERAREKSVTAFRDWLREEVRFRVEAAEMANGI